MRLERRRNAYLAGTAVLACALGIGAYAAGLFGGLEGTTQDSRFQIRGAEEPPDDVVLVLIDDVTLSDLNVRFPFPRSMHAEVIDQLRRDGARTIAYDIIFDAPTERREDEALIAGVRKARNVVLGADAVNQAGETRVLGDPETLDFARASVGFTLFPQSSGGTFRRVEHNVDGIPTLGVETVQRAEERVISEDEFAGGSTWIAYAGPPGTYEAHSYSDVINGHFERDAFRDKIVVVGASAPTLQDLHPVPTADDEEMSGPEIQANAIETVREGLPLQSTPFGVDIGLIILLGLLAPAASAAVRPLRAFAIALVGGAAYLGGTQLAFEADWIVPVTYPLFALATGAIGALAVNYLFTAFERQRVRDSFARFVPEAAVAEVLSQAEDGVRLGGRRYETTVLFSDIRGFTTFSEGRPAEEVLEILNKYLTEMSEAILDEGGTLTTYIGDGIMAVFGAPIEMDDHADRALRAAEQMLGPRLGAFNEWVVAQDLAEPFRMGVGLNSGPVMAGQVGSERRADYTAIGDTVNTAARLEGMTKGSGFSLFCAESTRAHLHDRMEELVYVDEMGVRGRQHGIKVWAMPEEGDESAPKPKRRRAAAKKPAAKKKPATKKTTAKKKPAAKKRPAQSK